MCNMKLEFTGVKCPPVDVTKGYPVYLTQEQTEMAYRKALGFEVRKITVEAVRPRYEPESVAIRYVAENAISRIERILESGATAEELRMLGILVMELENE